MKKLILMRPIKREQKKLISMHSIWCDLLWAIQWNGLKNALFLVSDNKKIVFYDVLERKSI